MILSRCGKCGRIKKAKYPTRVKRFKCDCRQPARKFVMFADPLLEAIAKEELKHENLYTRAKEGIL